MTAYRTPWGMGVAVAAAVSVMAGCAGDAASPNAAEPDAEVVIGQFFEAFNNEDVDAAMELMADEVVSSDDGLLTTPEEIRTSLLGVTFCPIELVSVTPSGSNLLVRIEFVERDGKVCPNQTAGATDTVVFAVEGGKITRIP